MRVLTVINDLGPAGAETLVRDLALTLPQFGAVTDVYVLRSRDDSYEAALSQAGVQVFSSGNLPIRFPGQVAALRRHLRRHAYEVVHGHLFPSILWVGLAGYPGPVVISEHSPYNRRRGNPLYRILDRRIYGRATRVVCVSRVVEEALHRWMPAAAGKTVIVPNGIRLDRFENVDAYTKREITGVDTDEALLLSVSRLQRVKGFQVLLEAMTRMQHRPHLALAGDGPERRALETRARDLGLKDRVHFLGSRTDVPRLLVSADVYVQPSRMEGFGIAVLEAMAAGRPVVVSLVPGLRDVVQGPEEAFFEPGDAEALARRVDAVLGDASLRNRLADTNRTRAREFSIEATARAYAGLYAQLTARSAA